MKILQIIFNLSGPSGGPAKSVLGLSCALAALGHQVSIFTIWHENLPFHAKKANGVEIYYFKAKWPKFYGYSPQLRNALEQRLDQYEIVHIHGLWVYPTLIASQLCQKKNIPYIIRPCGMMSRYCLSHHAVRKKLYYEFFEKKNLSKAGAIHFTSESENEFSSNKNMPVCRSIFPLGLGNEDFEFHGQEEGLSVHFPKLVGKKIILFIGRIHRIKGLDVLLKAFARIAQKDPAAHLVLAGPDGGYLKEIKSLVSSQQIEKQISFTGFVDGVRKKVLLQGSHIFCLPSYHESFGMAALEAMAARLPVIVSNRVGLCREIKEKDAGFVVPCLPHELERVLQELLQNENLRKKLGRKGRQLAWEKYRWEEIAPHLVRFYEKIISRTKLSEFALEPVSSVP